MLLRWLVVDHEHGAARAQRPVDDLDHARPVHPLKRLAEGDGIEPAEIKRADVLGPPLDPAHSIRAGAAARLVEHRRLGVQAHHLAERRRQFQRQHSGTAPGVEQPTGAVPAQSGG